MKRLSILLTMVVFIGFAAFAQQPIAPFQQSAHLVKNGGMKKILTLNQARNQIDTFGNLQPCDTTFFVWTFNPAYGASGYLSGHNTLLDSSKAEQYQGLPGNQINGLWMFFGVATSTSTTQKIHVKIWDATGAGGSPGAELANVDVPHQSIAADITAGNLTTVYFTTPVPMPAGGNFFAGFRMDYKKKQGVLTYDSTRAVALVNPDLFSDCGDSASNTAWDLAQSGYGGVWYTYWNAYGVGTRNPVFPIVETLTGCTVTITPSSATICKGKSASLTATSSSGTGTWTWAPSTGLNVTTGPTVSAKPKVTTTYTATNSGGCSATVAVHVNPQPKATISQGGCSAGHILLTRGGTPTVGVTYQWSLNGSNISGATNSTYSASVSGSYKVKVVITATGCNKTSKASTVTINCKMASSVSQFNADAYPNPFSKSVTVNFTTGSTETATIQLMDFSGRTLRIFNNVDATVPFEINENLTPGVYFIKVVQGSNEKIIKVVKSE